MEPPTGGIWMQDTSDGEAVSKQVYDFDIMHLRPYRHGCRCKPRFWSKTAPARWREWRMNWAVTIFSVQWIRRIALALLLPLISTSDLYRYLRAQGAGARNSSDDEDPPRQLGWTTGDGFVGKWEFTKAGRKMSPILTPTLRRNFAGCEIRRVRLQVDSMEQCNQQALRSTWCWVIQTYPCNGFRLLFVHVS